MSRELSGKTPISTLAWRYSFFIVTPIYLFILWIFYPALNTSSFIGKVWWLFYWWAMTNAGAFLVSVGGGIVLMRMILGIAYQTRREYYLWLQNGGDPFWDILPWPINTDPDKVRMAIGVPPDYDYCPNDGFPLGRRFGNQCRACGRYHDKG